MYRHPCYAAGRGCCGLIGSGVIVSFKSTEGEDGKISGNKKRREKEIAKDAQRETDREKGQEGIKEVIVVRRSATREVNRPLRPDPR